MNMMKKLIFIAVLAICMVGVAQANVTFNFDDVAVGASTAQIEAYMEGLYGSDITVDYASVGNDWAALGTGSDHYIYDSDSGQHMFRISFNVVPITSVSFDWAREDDPFFAVADGAEGAPFFKDEGGPGGGSNNGTLATYTFASPVTRLLFRDGGNGRIGIDNLTVTYTTGVIPAPGAILLGSIGVALVGWLRRRRAL